MKEKESYPEDFVEICKWVDEKITRKRNILALKIQEKKQIQMFLLGIIFLAFFILVVVATKQVTKVASWIVLIGTFIALIVYTIMSNLRLFKDKKEYKDDVLEEFAVHVPDVFVYDKHGEVSESKYRRSGFNKNYNSFYSNSCLEGSIDGRKIGIANILVESRKENSKKMKELFNGTFAYSTFKGEVPEIDLMKNNAPRHIKEKGLVEKLNLYMYSENNEESKEIVTDEVIDLIYNIKKEFNTELEIMIDFNNIYIRFFAGDIKNNSLFSAKNLTQMLYKYYKLIKFVSDLGRLVERNELIITEKTKRNRRLKIYPKIDLFHSSNEFDKMIEASDGVEIQFFDENKQTERFNIELGIEKIVNRFPNLKEITIHTPIGNYNLEHILFKDKKIFEEQLYSIANLADRYNIFINLLYHIEWNYNGVKSTGLEDIIRKSLPIIEGHTCRILLENTFMFEELHGCEVLNICKNINHEQLRACIDVTHVYVKSSIYKDNILNFIKTYLDKELCEKYVHQIHFSSVRNNDGYIDHSTHGLMHEKLEDVIFDLQWLKEYNLLNKNYITEITEKNYKDRPDQLKEIKMLSEAIEYMNKNG